MPKTTHQDFNGHHPKVRPWNRHSDYGVSIKVARLLSPKVMLLCASDDELLEPMVVEMGISDSGIWYVDTSGCSMLQANDAEPPPRRGWLHKAMQCAAVFLLGLMLLIGTTSCNKDPQPTPEHPNIPTDTVTPVNPGDTIPDIPGNDTILPPVPPIDTIQPDTIVPGPGGDTIVPGGGKVVNFYYDGGGHYPLLDTIRRYANDPEYDSIYIRWAITADYWTVHSFRVAHDSLKIRFDISQKVYGGWWIRPYKILPDSDSLYIHSRGMLRQDSVWYADRHYIVWPVVEGKNNR